MLVWLEYRVEKLQRTNQRTKVAGNIKKRRSDKWCRSSDSASYPKKIDISSTLLQHPTSSQSSIMVTAHPVDAITFSIQMLHYYATDLHKKYSESVVR